ncbi:hypothetical protein AX16_001544 [Volvariella volvacea WC 439]|nr:hypothetical protein AX16_001544 [Volvariella volvacea WC 439]
MSTTNQDSEPLDLYEIALLLNYERASTEPRFRHAKLREVANEEVNFQTIALKHDIWDCRPAAKSGFVFDICPPKGTSSTSTGKGKQRGSSNDGSRADVDDGAEPDLPSNMLPNPVPLQLQFYSQKELETIYWQARGHDGCFICIALLQAFFDLYPSDTPLHVRTLNDDYVTKISTRAISEMDLVGPKLMTLVALLPTNQILTTRESSSMPHSVMGFSRPKEGNFNIETVLDMASMQFDDEGRGLNGRSTFVLESFMRGTTAPRKSRIALTWRTRKSLHVFRGPRILRGWNALRGG